MEWFLKNLGYEVTLNQIDMNQTFISFLISIGYDQCLYKKVPVVIDKDEMCLFEFFKINKIQHKHKVVVRSY